MSTYKDAWNEKYQDLSWELFQAPYYELNDDQRKVLDERMGAWSGGYAADLADALRDKLKYGRLDRS